MIAQRCGLAPSKGAKLATAFGLRATAAQGSSNNVYSSLFYFNNASFVAKFRAKGKYKWEEYGSLEQAINNNYEVTPKPSIGIKSRRAGAIGYKVGMTGIWDKWGIYIPCTVIQIDRCQVIQLKENVNGKGLNMVQVGAGEANPNRLKKPQLGHFMKAGVPAKRHLAEFPITEDNFLPVGYMIGPSHFKLGNYVDVKGTSKGKGTQGTIKRWNFKHQSWTHGNSKAHRKPGALQGCEFPGKVFKGKKMAGRLGNESAIHYASKVIRIDNDRSILYVKGSIPGPIGGMLKIRDSHKKLTKQKQEANEIDTGVDTWPGDELDPNEQYEHENVGVAGPDNDED